MTNLMPFPPRARKSAGIVKEGHEHLQHTSEIIHQHRLSLASQIRKFDARWASLFNLAPVLNKLTKGRQVPTEFRDNAQVLLDDVQHALHDAHGRKLPKIPEEGASIVPGPPPQVPISTGRTRSLASWRRRQGVESQAPSEKQSIIVRVRSKLKRKKAVKRKGSKKGPLSQFNIFRSKSTTTPNPNSLPQEATVGEFPPAATTVRHRSSRHTMRSGGSSRFSTSRKKKKKSSSKSSSLSRVQDSHPNLAPLIDPEWKPHLPPPPNFSPMKLDMSSIGHYSPTITKPLLYQPPPWPGIGIVNSSGPRGATPSSPQPYYIEERREREGKERKEKSSRSREHGGGSGREHKPKDDDRHGSGRRHKHRHHSHRSRDADSGEDSRRDHYHHRSSRDDDYSDSRKREKHTSETRRRRHDDSSRRKHSSKGSSTPTSPSSYTHHHNGFQPTLPHVVERSRFQENFSVIS